jgi:hypothetical protein
MSEKTNIPTTPYVRYSKRSIKQTLDLPYSLHRTANFSAVLRDTEVSSKLSRQGLTNI